MNFEIISIIQINFPVILPFIVGAIIVFILSFYVIFEYKIKKFVLFDIIFFLLFSGLFFARLLGVINSFDEYRNLEWRILPLEDTSTNIELVRSLPWNLFNIFDGNIILLGIPLGILAGASLLYLFSNREKKYYTFIDNIIWAFLPSHIVLLIGALLSKLYYGKEAGIINVFIEKTENFRLNILLIELIVFLATVLSILIIKFKVKIKGAVTAIFLIMQGIDAVIVLPNAEQFHTISDDIYWISLLGSVMIAIGILIYLQIFIHSFTVQKIPRVFYRSRRNQNGIIYKLSQDKLIDQPIVTDIELRQPTPFISKLKSIFKWKKRN